MTQSNLLLNTKLYIPPPRSNLVPRPRLIERLNAGQSGKLTLVSAPAGYGKTTLISDWVAQSQAPVAWLSLDEGDNYLLLISLVAFSVTVVITRIFLQLTGFPQIGDSVLHIAHALWGGLLLFIAVLIPLAFANHWAIQASAILGGIGIGLFIDEVGKFITQTNDYFFPPALSIVYGFFLLTVLVYLYFRRPRHEDPRQAMYHA